MLVMGIGLSVMMNARLALVFIVCAPVLALIMFFIVRSVGTALLGLAACGG